MVGASVAVKAKLCRSPAAEPAYGVDAWCLRIRPPAKSSRNDALNQGLPLPRGMQRRRNGPMLRNTGIGSGWSAPATPSQDVLRRDSVSALRSPGGDPNQVNRLPEFRFADAQTVEASLRKSAGCCIISAEFEDFPGKRTEKLQTGCGLWHTFGYGSR